MVEKRIVVPIHLNATQMAVVEQWRQAIKATTGRSCTHSSVITGLINAFSEWQEHAEIAAKAAKEKP